MELIVSNWRLAAVAALFFLGVAARRAGWGNELHGRKLLNFVFNVGLPILIFGALTGVPLSREHALLPVIAILVSLLGWAAAAFMAQRLRLPMAGEGAMTLCAMSMNISFRIVWTICEIIWSGFSTEVSARLTELIVSL